MEKKLLKKITIKGFDVELHLVDVGLKLKDTGLTNWYCAYVTFAYTLKDSYGSETFREVEDKGVVIGIDTAHFYNINMSMEEKEIDAINQITEIIDEHIYLEKVKNNLIGEK